VTWNIHAGLAGADAVARAMHATEADIFLLQEARKPLRGGLPDPAPGIVQAFLGWHSARGGSAGELLILSRHPVRESSERPLSPLRPCLRARLEVDGRSLVVYNVHFNTGRKARTLAQSRWQVPQYLRETAEVRREQADVLAQQIQAEREPVLVGGDFNSPPGSAPQLAMSGLLQDTFARYGRGFGWTYPAGTPLLRIDYLFAGARLTVRSCEVLGQSASDHRAVRATLGIEGVAR
jgi:vancomycin resistance protein VanJ